MDPFTLSTGIAGFLSLTIEVIRILTDYFIDVKDAPKDVQDLLDEVNAVPLVLGQLQTFLKDEEVDVLFEKTSILRSVMEACKTDIETVCSKISKLRKLGKGSKMKALATHTKDRMAWPYSKDECQQILEKLH
jgi:hypothetical protein